MNKKGPLTEGDFIQKLQWRLIQTAVGGSALRNQGGSLVEICRNYINSEIKLDNYFKILKDDSERHFLEFLNSHTYNLKKRLPNENFGAARKALNLFFRDVVYNNYLCNW